MKPDELEKDSWRILIGNFECPYRRYPEDESLMKKDVVFCVWDLNYTATGECKYGNCKIKEI